MYSADFLFAEDLSGINYFVQGHPTRLAWPLVHPKYWTSKRDVNEWYRVANNLRKIHSTNTRDFLVEHHIHSVWDGSGILIILIFPADHYGAWVCKDAGKPNAPKIVYQHVHKLLKLDKFPQYELKYSKSLGLFPTIHIKARKPVTPEIESALKKHVQNIWKRATLEDQNITIVYNGETFDVGLDLHLSIGPRPQKRIVSYVMNYKNRFYDEEDIKEKLRQLFPKEFELKFSIIANQYSRASRFGLFGETLFSSLFMAVYVPLDYKFSTAYDGGKHGIYGSTKPTAEPTDEKSNLALTKKNSASRSLEKVLEGTFQPVKPVFLYDVRSRHLYDSKSKAHATKPKHKLELKDNREEEDKSSDNPTKNPSGPKPLRCLTPGKIVLNKQNPQQYTLQGFIGTNIPLCYYCGDFGHLKRDCRKNPDPTGEEGREAWKRKHDKELKENVISFLLLYKLAEKNKQMNA